MAAFDIIGDIHGCSLELTELLRILGYRERNGAFRHESGGRRILFLGDYIDRGPEIPAVVDTVRAMVEADTAVALLGNHEYNAVAFHTAGPQGWLRSRSDAHMAQHLQTLCQYGIDSPRWKSALNWFRSLPVFYEDATLRAVHAAWIPDLIGKARSSPSVLRSDQFLAKSAERGSFEFQLIENVLKGVEIPLPPGTSIVDKEGKSRQRTRVRWWLGRSERARSYRDIAMPPYEGLPDVHVPPYVVDLLPGYDGVKPVFFGHYWLRGDPSPLAPQIACLDYSAARGGRLAAYRFDGERNLRPDAFVSVPAR